MVLRVVGMVFLVGFGVCVCFYDLSLLLEIEFCCAGLVSVFAGQGSPSAGHS